MIRTLIVLAAAAAAFGLAAFWFLTIPGTIPPSALAARTPNLDNGKTMFFAGGCASCHALPNQDDKTKLGGGLALPSPFGTFHVPNISPDSRDGIGAWSEAQFVTALNKGTSPQGAHYYPSLPYTSYQQMRFDDVRDLFAYLKTLPPLQGRVRDHELPFPFNIRRTLGGWKLLFLNGEPFRPDPSKPAQWNRGAYLVNGPGHCAECHSPRNILGGVITSQRFAGGPHPEGEGWIPNITQHALADWSVEDFAELLETGFTPKDRVAGRMREVVENTSQLPAPDREAMAVYLKSLAPVEGPKRSPRN